MRVYGIADEGSHVPQGFGVCACVCVEGLVLVGAGLAMGLFVHMCVSVICLFLCADAVLSGGGGSGFLGWGCVRAAVGVLRSTHLYKQGNALWREQVLAPTPSADAPTPLAHASVGEQPSKQKARKRPGTGYTKHGMLQNTHWCWMGIWVGSRDPPAGNIHSVSRFCGGWHPVLASRVHACASAREFQSNYL